MTNLPIQLFSVEDTMLKNDKNTEYSTTLECNADSMDQKILLDGLNAHAKESGYFPVETFNFFTRNSDKKIVGGVWGYTAYGALTVSVLWVDSAHRGKGLGKILIECVEGYAKEKKCAFIWVDTLSFEAPKFYEKLGYRLEMVHKGFQNDAEMHRFVKPIEQVV